MNEYYGSASSNSRTPERSHEGENCEFPLVLPFGDRDTPCHHLQLSPALTRSVYENQCPQLERHGRCRLSDDVNRACAPDIPGLAPPADCSRCVAGHRWSARRACPL